MPGVYFVDDAEWAVSATPNFRGSLKRLCLPGQPGRTCKPGTWFEYREFQGCLALFAGGRPVQALAAAGQRFFQQCMLRTGHADRRTGACE